MKIIYSIAELDQELNNNIHNFVVAFVGGLKSSKFITKEEDLYYVLHLIDDSEDIWTKDDLLDSTIGRAMSRGAFYAED
jgi:hypothetical protein